MALAPAAFAAGAGAFASGDDVGTPLEVSDRRQFCKILLRGVHGLALFDEPLALGFNDRPDESRPGLRLGVALLASEQKQLGWTRHQDARAGHR